MIILATFVLGSSLFPFAMQQEKVSVWEAKYLHEKELLAISGVKRVSVGGIGEKYHIVVSVDSALAGKLVMKKTEGALDGWPVHISVSKGKVRGTPPGEKPRAKCSTCVCPCHKKGKTVDKAPEPTPNDPEQLCDIMRKLLKNPRRKGAREPSICRQMIGWTNDPKVKKWVLENGLPNWVSKEFGGRGEVVAYTYIKHRRGCPIRDDDFLRRVKELTPRKKK